MKHLSILLFAIACTQASPSDPVTALDLAGGTWCSVNQPGALICLDVEPPQNARVEYTYTQGSCLERGTLSGALYVELDVQSDYCVSIQRKYHTTVNFVDSGIHVVFPDSRTLDLEQVQ